MANEIDYIPCKYRGNGLTSDFPFAWKIFKESDIVAHLEDVVSGKQVILQHGTDYSVVFNDVGGFIAFKNPPTEDNYIIISRNVSDYQRKTYSTSTGFQGSELENSFDAVSCNIQEVEYDLKRAIKIPVGSSVLNLELPLPHAGKTLKWNEEENSLVNSEIDVDTLENIAHRLHESIDNIDTVADNIDNVNTVADNIDIVNVVSSDIENVNAVGNDIANVNAVAGNETNINAVNDNATNINTVASAIDNVNAVGNDIANVNAVANNETNINEVNDNATNINTVASAIDNVNAVGNNIANVNAVANNETNINAVASIKDDISIVSDYSVKISRVSENIDNIKDVNDNKLYIDTVARHISEVCIIENNIYAVKKVANNETNINAVNGNKTNIDTVAGAINNVNAVGNDIANVNAVANNETNINAVNGNKTNIDTVAGAINNVNTVGNDIANVNAVANNETNINAVVDNLEDIQSVPNYVLQAKESAKQSIYRDLFQCNSLNVNAENPKTYFEHIKNLKCSTFDKSKFNIIGSPTISNDGIVDGMTCNSNNKVTTPLNIEEATELTLSVDIICSYVPDEILSGAVFGYGTQYFYCYCNCLPNGSFQFDMHLRKDASTLIKNISFHNNKLDDRITLKWQLKDDVWTLSIANNGVVKAQTTVSDVEDLFPMEAENFLLTSSISTGMGVNTDLKSVKLVVDGEEVFSGNKTGVDVIKTDNYTGAGTYTVTDDGIASGFSGMSSDTYLRSTDAIDTTNAQSAKFEYKFKVKELPSTAGQCFLLNYSDTTINGVPNIQIYNPSSDLTPRIQFGNLGFYKIPEAGHWYKAIINLSGDNYEIELYEDDTLVFNNTGTLEDWKQNNPIYLYGNFTLDTGSVILDLNECKIFVDNELVYQPCLKIPYTESKTGTKIVDVSYRNRVQDVYEQGFDKYYYTIDEENKTVDELYGYNQILSNSKTNDSKVTKYADGTVEICCRVETAGIINLPVTLKDTNYFCTLPTTEKTTTSFTTTQTGDFILKGELA